MKKNNSKEAFYQRLNSLAEVKKVSIKESTRNLGSLIDYKRASDGIAYGIIKENHNYYIKKAGLKQDPNVADFAYIGGLSNVTNYQFHSLSEADKHRNMLFHTINETTKYKANPNGGKKRLLGEGVEESAEDEINAAEKGLNDAEAAATTSKINSEPITEPESGLEGGSEVPALSPEPESGLENGSEVPALSPEPESDLESGEDVPNPEGSEEENPESDDNTENSGDSMTPDDQKSLTVQDIESKLGKLTNLLRKTELEPQQVQGYVKTFLAPFKDDFKEMDISDRKGLADIILKVVPDEEIANLDVTPEEKAAEMAEGECSECQGFGNFAESLGYTKESLMECGDEEKTNVISRFANGYNDGENKPDFKLVALLSNPEIINSLKNDYGHEEFADNLTPYTGQMNEGDDISGQIDELWGGLSNLGKAAVGGISKGMGQAGQTIKGAAKDIYQAGAEKVGQAVQNVKQAGQNVAQGIGNAATTVKQTYHSGEVAGEMKKANDLANQFAQQINTMNQRLKKAGQIPIDTTKVIQGITNQLTRGGQANVAGTSAGAVIKSVEEDVDAVETQPNIGFAPPAQSLGVVSEAILNPKQKGVAPQGKVKTGIENGVAFNKTIKRGIKEDIKLSKEKKSETTKQTKTGKDVGKKETNKPVINESEIKLRKYIRNRIEEKAGLRKSTLNESTKPEALKKLDKVIDEQFKNFKGNIDEGFMDAFSSNASKFEKINQADPNSINDAFNKIFSQSLMAAARKQAAMRMSAEQKYALMQQGYQMDKLKNPSFGLQGGNFIYTPLKTENPFASGGTGGKTSMGGV